MLTKKFNKLKFSTFIRVAAKNLRLIFNVSKTLTKLELLKLQTLLCNSLLKKLEKFLLLDFLFAIQDYQFIVLIKCNKKLDIKTPNFFTIEINSVKYVGEVFFLSSGTSAEFLLHALKIPEENIINISDNFNEILTKAKKKLLIPNTLESEVPNTNTLESEVGVLETVDQNLILSKLNQYGFKHENLTSSSFFISRVSSLNLSIQEIKTILNTNDSLYNKQTLLEGLNTNLLKLVKKKTFRLPKKFVPLINLIQLLTQSIVIEDYQPTNLIALTTIFFQTHTKLFTDKKKYEASSVLNQESVIGVLEQENTDFLEGALDQESDNLVTGDPTFLVEEASFSKSKIFSLSQSTFYCKLFFYFYILELKEEDFGLIAIHFLSQIISDAVSTEKNFNTFSNQDAIDFINELKKKETSVYQFKRTFFKEKLSKLVLEHFTNLINLMLLKEAAYITNINLKLLEFNKKIQSQNPDFFLKQKNFKLEIDNIFLSNCHSLFTSEEKILFGDFMLVILETTEIFSYSTVKKIEYNQMQTITYINISETIVYDLFKVCPFINNLPMIIEPNDWEILEIKKNKKLNLGGYFSNRFIKKDAVALHNAEDFVNISDRTINLINGLQKTRYTINTLFLKEVWDNLPFFCQHFAEDSNESLTFGSVFEPQPDGLTLLSQQNFLQKIFLNTEISLLQKKIDVLEKTMINNSENNKTDENLEKEIISKKKKLKTLFNKGLYYYLKVVSKILTFLQILFVADSFKDYSIFFVWSFCSRFRIYLNAGLFNVQGSNFCKSLLELQYKNENYSRSLHLDSATNNLIDVQKEENYKDSMKKASKIFLHLKHQKNILHNVVSLDVSSSGFQIYSGLVGNLEGLKTTNFFFEINSLNSYSLDFYSVFLKKFINFLAVSTFNPKSFNLKEFLISLINRTFIKDLLLCFLYSEGTRSRVLKLVSLINLSDTDIRNNILKELASAVLIDMGLYRYVYKIAKEISEQFEILFAKEYPEIFQLKFYLENLFCKSQTVGQSMGVLLKISENENVSSSFSVAKKKIKKKYTYFSGKTKKYNQYVLEVSENKVDLNQIKSSIGPNFIHRIDAEILNEVVLLCANNNIPVYCAHDSFYVFPEHAKKVKNFYFEAFKQVVLSGTCCETFFLANKINFDKNAINFLKECKERTQLIIQKIDSKELIMSDFILKP